MLKVLCKRYKRKRKTENRNESQQKKRRNQPNWAAPGAQIQAAAQHQPSQPSPVPPPPLSLPSRSHLSVPSSPMSPLSLSPETLAVTSAHPAAPQNAPASLILSPSSPSSTLPIPSLFPFEPPPGFPQLPRRSPQLPLTLFVDSGAIKVWSWSFSTPLFLPCPTDYTDALHLSKHTANQAHHHHLKDINTASSPAVSLRRPTYSSTPTVPSSLRSSPACRRLVHHH
jgi:hypothetical protein